MVQQGRGETFKSLRNGLDSSDDDNDDDGCGQGDDGPHQSNSTSSACTGTSCAGNHIDASKASQGRKVRKCTDIAKKDDKEKKGRPTEQYFRSKKRALFCHLSANAADT